MDRQQPLQMTTAKRVRTGAPRSKNGCSICRQRHYKCDEQLPQCGQCRSSGWTCPGYAPKTGSPPSLAIGDISRYALAFQIPGTQHERKVLHHFTNFAAADMSAPLSSSFWSRTILQRCQHETPLRHAAVALGQVHVEYIATPKQDNFQPSHATVQAYGKAIKSLRSYMGNKPYPSRPVVLMCSAIFVCFDLIRGERVSALRHLRSALKILKIWRKEGLASQDWTTEEQTELLSVFARLDFEATIFDQHRVPLLRLEEDALLDSRNPPHTDERALHEQVMLLSHCALLFLVQSVPYKRMDINHVPKSITSRRKSLIQQLSLWEQAADKFKAQAETDFTIATASPQALYTSFLRCRILRLYLIHSLNDPLDAVEHSFDGKEAVQLLTEAESALSFHSTARRSFALHSGVVAPMFLLALKTSDPDVRERALKVLRSVQGRQEGFYDACTLMKIVLELEKMAGSVEKAVALDQAADDLMESGESAEELVGSGRGQVLDESDETLVKTFKLLDLAG